MPNKSGYEFEIINDKKPPHPGISFTEQIICWLVDYGAIFRKPTKKPQGYTWRKGHAVL